MILYSAAFLVLIFAGPVYSAMSCLVMRPGYGLVSEECPTAAVGCRIRAKKDHIEWYELSRLYDRNQLVCVYPEEYKSLTGCMRKPSGSIRCWCGGRADCNDPEISKDLYEAYTEGDNESIEELSEWLKNIDNGPRKKSRTTSAKAKTSTTTTTTTTTTRRPTTTTARRTTTTSRPTPRITTARKLTVKTTKTTLPAKKTTPQTPAVVLDQEEEEYVDDEKAVPLKTDSPSTVVLDSSFEATRKKLEAQMKEEDERIREMLADEEDEMSDEDEDAGLLTAEDQRRREREQYRMERRRAEERREREDDILERIEEEEMNEAKREREGRERRLSEQNSSHTVTFLVTVIFLIISRLL